MKKLLIPFLLLLVISACGTETEPDFDPPAPQPQPEPPVADKRAQYTVTLTFTDSSREIELRFGQHANPTTQDEQMPPAPPEGTLHAYFTKDENKSFWRDFRSENSEAEKWDFTYQTGTNGPVLLKWNIQTTRFPGTLTLVNPKDDSSIKMEATGEFELPTTATGKLIFEYKINN